MKTVFFTGAAGGLGGATVKLLANRGWTIFAADVDDAGLAELEAIPNVIPIKADVTSTESMQAAYDIVRGHTDKLDAIANFAGLSSFSSLIEGDPIAICDRIVATNVMGTIRTNTIFFPLVEAGKGRIINCSSSTGWMTAQPFSGAYTLSKRAIEGYTDCLRRELGFLGIPVVKIQPGSYKTPLTDGLRRDYDKVFAETTHYHDVLATMKPMMTSTLDNSGDPPELAEVVVKALEAPRPRMQYRKNSGAALLMMEMLPEKAVDAIYKLFPKLSTLNMLSK